MSLLASEVMSTRQKKQRSITSGSASLKSYGTIPIKRGFLVRWEQTSHNESVAIILPDAVTVLLQIHFEICESCINLEISVDRAKVGFAKYNDCI